MNKGKICSQCFQYDRKVSDFQRPCTITMKGSIPRRRRCVVPPILKLCPVNLIGKDEDQASLQRSMNHDQLMGAQEPSFVSKENNGAVGGVSELTLRWFWKAARALQLQLESVQHIHSPLGLVLVEGAKKPPYCTWFDAVPVFIGVFLGACHEGSNWESEHNSLRRHWHQKATQATAHVAASKVLDRSR